MGRTSGGPPETRRVHDALWTPGCKRPARKEYVSLGETGVETCWSVDNADRRHTLRSTEMTTGPRAEPWGRLCKDLRGRRRGDRNVPGGELRGADAGRFFPTPGLSLQPGRPRDTGRAWRLPPSSSSTPGRITSASKCLLWLIDAEGPPHRPQPPVIEAHARAEKTARAEDINDAVARGCRRKRGR